MSQDAGAQFAALHEQIQQRLNQAIAASEAAEGIETAKTGTGSSEDHEVTVTVDGKGVVQAVQFDDAIRDLDAEELATATKAALAAAQEDVRPPQPSRGGLSALHDDSLLRQFDELLESVRRQS